MNARCDVLILGGGVIGLTTAYYLARAGAKVTILERGEFGREASWAGAGIIPPGNPDFAHDSLSQLRAWSSATFPVISEELRELTSIDNGYMRCGAVELKSGVDETAIRAWQAERIEYIPVTPVELSSIDHELVNLPESGFFLPDAAQVRNPWHLRALEQACRQLGVHLQSNTPVHELQSTGERVLCARGGGQSWLADRFLVASGAWSDELLAPFGCRLGIHPIRGQMVLFRTPARPFRPIILQGPRYLVPRSDGRVLAGSTEEDVGFDRTNTPHAVAELCDFALRIAPCLSRATIETTWAGLRPATQDGLPFLGPVPGIGNLYVAAGHFRSGIQLSPATGKFMAEALLGNANPILQAFALDRQVAPKTEP